MPQMCKCVQVCSKLIVIVGDMRVKSAKRGELCKQSRAAERKIAIGKTESRRAGTGGRCMDFLRAILYCTIRAHEGGAKVQGEEKEE